MGGPTTSRVGTARQVAPPGGRFGGPDWRRRVWRLALPIMAANITVPLLGIVDTAVVGHLGDPAYIGAIAVGATVFSFVFWCFGFLRMGTTGLTSQALGAAQGDELRAILGRAGLLALGLGLVIVVLQQPIALFGVGLIAESPDVAYHAQSYVEIRILGAPATLLNYVLLGWFLGVQRTGTALVVQLFLNILNILLNLVFVLGFGWDVPGVAAASALSEVAAALLGLYFVGRLLRGVEGGWSRARILDAARIRRLVAVNVDIFIRTACLVTAFAWFTWAGGTLGENSLAANAVLRNVTILMAYALDGFAHAAETLVGDRFGARDRRGLSDAVRASTAMAAATAVIFACLAVVGGGLLVDVMTDLESVRALARDYMIWLIIHPLVAVWSFQLDGVFIGATRTAAMRNAMIASLAIFLVAERVLTPWLGNDGLWLAITVFMAARAASLALAYPRLLAAVEKTFQEGKMRHT
ncbi:MAG: MATE family efflux transporter [Azospirillaceae bacterium]